MGHVPLVLFCNSLLYMLAIKLAIDDMLEPAVDSTIALALRRTFWNYLRFAQA
jgi:hypothetical protein